MSAWHPIRTVLFATTALVPLGLAVASANPLGPNVVGGAAQVTGTGTANVTVNQSTQNAVINWQTFNIGAGETTRFVQPNSSSMTLNRVTGQMGPSSIYGAITANGRVFIVNPEGILIGRGATINTAGFLATTHDISTADFMANRMNFNIPGRPDASVVNLGTITATNAGFAALVAPGVRNSGTITATFGKIALASANGFSLDLYGDQLITLGVNDAIAHQVRDVATGQTLSSLVKNDGVLKANGGRVELTAAAARVVVNSVINTSGVIEARTIGQRNGKIVLGAATAATKPAGAPQQIVKVSGKLTVAAKKTKAGTVQVTGENIQLANANIDATGRLGGGTVLIGGDTGGGVLNPAVASIPQAQLQVGPVPNASTVTIDNATVINASATHTGNAGKVVVWADQSTAFAGQILARGGALGGDGGFVEVSGKQTLTFAGNVNTLAPMGRAGTLLLDPADFTIGFVTTVNQISNTDLQNQLASNNVVITNNAGVGNGDIFVTSNVTWSSSFSLTLSAFRHIDITAGSTIKNTGAGDLILRADNTGTGIGTLHLFAGTFLERIDYSGSTGKISLYYNPTVFGTQDVFPTTGNPRIALNNSVADQFTAYMLVNTVSKLGSIGTNLSGNYALATNLNVGNFSPIGSVATPFTGKFDGLGNTLNNVVIAPTAPSVSNLGLFAVIGLGGTVQNLNLSNVTVTANPNVPDQFIGTLAGQNYGTVLNVTAAGTINGGAMQGLKVGGLVGQNGPLGNLVVAAKISSSSANVNITVGDGCTGANCMDVNIAGGLVGWNVGTILNSQAHGNVVGGSNTVLGGLVGTNQNFDFNNNNFIATPLIDQSFATGNVSSAGIQVALGGLVGFNAPAAVISDSHATGNVTATANLPECNFNSNCTFVVAGGLVGMNFGTITATNTPVFGATCVLGETCAKGVVSVGSRATAGGLVGQNDGIIENTFAVGNVTGAAGPGTQLDDGDQTTLAGLVGHNSGLITFSFATGDVGALNVNHLRVGGLVGDNSGTIANSAAYGNVKAGDFSVAGGFVAHNGVNDGCVGCFAGDGSFFNNTALIGDSNAFGNVNVGSRSIAGGFAGITSGVLFQVTADGNVHGVDNTFLGGLAGVAIDSDVAGALPGVIAASVATGNVTSTGDHSMVGGLVGLNAVAVLGSVASGDITGTSSSFLGGFAGMNLGLIVDIPPQLPTPGFLSATLGTSVTGTGSFNVIGGFVGANFGLIVNSTSTNHVIGGANNLLGRFAGLNATLTNVPSDLILGSTLPVGTIVNSVGTGTVNGNAGPQIGPLGTLPALPSVLANCDNPVCVALRNGKLDEGVFHPPDKDIVLIAQVLGLLTDTTTKAEQAAVIDALISLTPPPTPPAGQTPGGPGGTPSPGSSRPVLSQPFAPPQFDRAVVAFDGTRNSGLPPLNETRFFANEVVLQMRADLPPDAVDLLARQLGLTVITSENLNSLGRRAIRFRIGAGRTVRDVIRVAEQNSSFIAQPNYWFKLTQAPAALPPRPEVNRGDAAQYTLQKLSVHDVHRLTSGTNVTIAVIDSEVDKDHAELSGRIKLQFDAVGAASKAHSHGTAMAGAIIAGDRLLGVAPGANILAVRAFSESQTTAEGTTFSILKGIEWAVSQGARVINMSFAGPYDPALEKALKAAHDKGVVLVAAAGNAGPKSPPLFPGADTHVIGVTATDDNDRLFKGANRGAYVSVAAPGVEILAAAPDGSYQMSTGTSIATAHVSAVIALMIERDPTLTPADVRQILQDTAIDLGPKGKDPQFGWGLVSPQKALAAVEERKKRPAAATKP